MYLNSGFAAGISLGIGSTFHLKRICVRVNLPPCCNELDKLVCDMVCALCATAVFSLCTLWTPKPLSNTHSGSFAVNELALLVVFGGNHGTERNY